MSKANKTAMTFETDPSGDASTRWTTTISDAATGHVELIFYSSTEEAGREWAANYLNSGKEYDYSELDVGKPIAYEDYFESKAPDPPPPEPSPKIPVTCYRCGSAVDATHLWNNWTNELTLESKHCGQLETKRFSLETAKELAKVGWMAFLII
jgi:hypothetical protein